MGAVSSYPTDTADATDFLLGCDSGGNVKRYSIAGFGLLGVAGSWTAVQTLAGVVQAGNNLVRIENTNAALPAGASGQGMELHRGGLTFYNRSTFAFTAALYNAATHDWAIGGAVQMAMDGSGNVFCNGSLSVADNAFGAGWNGSLKTTTENAVYDAAVAMLSSYRTILDSSGSHIAARVAGTYGLGQGDPAAISGTGTLYPLNVMYIDPADYPSAGGLTAKMRIRASVMVNDVAPTGNYTFGLHPVTRPATSGGAGLNIYTIGTAVSGSTVAVNTPAADSANNLVGSDFAVPSAGFYVLGVVTTATVAASSHLHLSAALQLRHT